MSPIYGSCHDPFLALRNLLSDNLSSGAAIDASVVDWGGHADEARTRPWERDTLTNVFSSTKPPHRAVPAGPRRPPTSRFLSEPTYDVILGGDPDAVPADWLAVRRPYFTSR